MTPTTRAAFRARGARAGSAPGRDRGLRQHVERRVRRSGQQHAQHRERDLITPRRPRLVEQRELGEARDPLIGRQRQRGVRRAEAQAGGGHPLDRRAGAPPRPGASAAFAGFTGGVLGEVNFMLLEESTISANLTFSAHFGRDPRQNAEATELLYRGGGAAHRRAQPYLRAG
jgi:hypothetical protein